MSTRGDLADGYRVSWRLTESPTWDRLAWVGDTTEHTLDGLVIDDFFFGVASVSADGHDSPVVFPRPAPRRSTAGPGSTR